MSMRVRFIGLEIELALRQELLDGVSVAWVFDVVGGGANVRFVSRKLQEICGIAREFAENSRNVR